MSDPRRPHRKTDGGGIAQCPTTAREVAKIAAALKVPLADLVRQAIAAHEGARLSLIEAASVEFARLLHEAMRKDIVAAIDDGIEIGKQLATAAHPGAAPSVSRQAGEGSS